MADELSDNDIFDSIVSGNPVPEHQPEPAPQPQPSQQRDDGGRFAPKQEVQPAATQPLAVEPNTQEDTHETGGIPQARLKAEAEKRREAEADAAALRREVAELRGMVQANRQPAPQPQQEEQPVSLFENPDEYLKNQLTPVQQQMQEMREMMWEGQAAQTHGIDAVEAAKKAAEALFGKPEGAELHRRLTAGGNPFDHLVKWHKQQQAFAKVGDDPDKWLNDEIERRLTDPAEQAKILERIRAGTAPSPSPTGRPTPVTQLPPSLSRIPSGGNAPAAQGDVSDEALFSSITTGRR